jgi:hypothetical protein
VRLLTPPNAGARVQNKMECGRYHRPAATAPKWHADCRKSRGGSLALRTLGYGEPLVLRWCNLSRHTVDTGQRWLFKTLGSCGAVGLEAPLAGQKAQTSQATPVSDSFMVAMADIPTRIGGLRCECGCRDAARFARPPSEEIESRNVFPGPPRCSAAIAAFELRLENESHWHGCGGVRPAGSEQHGRLLRTGTRIARLAGRGVGLECAGPSGLPVTPGSAVAGARQGGQRSVCCVSWTASATYHAAWARCRCPTCQVASPGATAEGPGHAATPLGLGRSGARRSRPLALDTGDARSRLAATRDAVGSVNRTGRR